MKITNDNLVGRAKLFLATQFDGHWDGEHLWIEDNEIHLAFDQGVAERNGELMLTDSVVAIPGEKLGHRVMVAVRAFSDPTGALLLVGPCANLEYWDAPNGTNPDRHPWLEFAGDEHGDPVFGYRPGRRQ